MAPTIRTTSRDDAEAIADLSARVYPASPYTAAQVLAQIERFPDGQFVAATPERIYGMSSCLRVDEAQFALAESWNVVTGDGSAATHRPTGGVLYSIDTMIAPEARRMGLGRLLLEQRFHLATRLECRLLRSGVRLSGYAGEAHRLTPEGYLDAVLAGRRHDPSVSFMLGCGFIPRVLAPGYLRVDPESLGVAVIMDWWPPQAAEENTTR